MGPKGTPKTLAEAVVNGLSTAFPEEKWKAEDAVVRNLVAHVRDRLAQDFATATARCFTEEELRAQEALFDLWNRIFPKEEK